MRQVVELKEGPVVLELPNYTKRLKVYSEYSMELQDAEETIHAVSDLDLISVIGIGNDSGFTTAVIGHGCRVIGYRKKISIFTGENSKISPVLEAYDILDVRPGTYLRLGVVLCREVLSTAIAEVYRMMGVNLLAVTISGGGFKDMQRASWIDQMFLFADICNCNLVCCSGSPRKQGGLNLIIKDL